jgi:hypothetical protein
MRRTTALLVMVFGSWLSSLGQSAPKFTAPQIVATFHRLNQAAEIPPTTVYTPKSWGTFRISIVMVGTVANGTSNTDWAGLLQFTDADGENVPCDGCGTFLPLDRLRNSVIEFPIRARAGKPIKFFVKSEGDTSGTEIQRLGCRRAVDVVGGPARRTRTSELYCVLSARSFRRQIDSPGAPIASAPSVAGCGVSEAGLGVGSSAPAAISPALSPWPGMV